MKLKNLLTKTLLAAGMLCFGGGNSWGADALTSSFTVTGYEYSHLFDLQNKTYDGTSFSAYEDLVSTFGVTSQQTIQTDYANGVWYDDSANKRGLRHNGGGGRWIQFTVDIKKDDYVIINGGIAGTGTYGMTMTNGESVDIPEASDYLCFKATQDVASLKLTVNRYNYLLQILVMTKDASVATADYTINYNENGVTVKTVSGNEAVGTVIPVLSSFIEGGKKYITNDGQASSLTIAAGGSSLEINVTEAPQYTCTVNAISNETILASPSATVYSGENAKVFYKKGYKNGGVWYMTAANGSYPSYAHNFSAVSGNSSFDVTTYAANANIVFFGEVEEMNREGNFAADGGQVDRYSNGVAKRLYSAGGATPSAGSCVYTDEITPGVYTVTMWARNQSSSQNATLPVYLRDSEGNMLDLSTSFENWTPAGQGEKSVEVTVPNDGKTYSIAVYNYSGWNSNLEMDYVYVTLVRPLTTTTTITADYGTFSSPYALDFTPANGVTGVVAYYASAAADGKVTMTKVTGTVPANTGLFLAKDGTGNAISIPVVASSTTELTNLLMPGTGAEVEAGNYVFAKQDDDYGFYRLGSATVVPTGKAYLKAGSYSARMSIAFDDDETTGISATLMNSEESTVNSVFDLQGRRVAQPQKGLYIMNGKKVVIK